MRPIDRLKAELKRYAAELKAQGGQSETRVLKGLGLPTDTFKNIRKGSLPSKHETRVALCKLFGKDMNHLFGAPERQAADTRNLDRSPNNRLLTKVDDPGSSREDPAMQRDLDEIGAIYKRLGTDDRYAVLQYLRNLDRAQAAREAAEPRPTGSVAR